jgi:hypothetical protein
VQLSAVQLARIIAFVETSDLNPRGRIFFPAILPLIVNRFNFQKYPNKFEDFDEQKGVDFIGGYDANAKTAVDKLTIWNNGIGLDVRSSTSEARAILEGALEWLKKEIGLVYEPTMIKRWAYLSGITFFSDVDFDGINPAVSRLCSRLSSSVSEIQGEQFDYHFGGMTISFDKSVKAAPVAQLIIARRADTPFSQGKWFSEAPLPTETHIKLLEEFEADLLSK